MPVAAHLLNRSGSVLERDRRLGHLKRVVRKILTASMFRKGHAFLQLGVHVDANERPVQSEAAADRLMNGAFFGLHDDVLQLLRSGEVSVDTRDSKGRRALHWAAVQAPAAMIQDLVDRGASVDAGDDVGFTALMMASMHGHVEGVLQLLLAGAPTETRDAAGFTALHWGASQGHLDVVRMLVEHNVDINERDAHGRTATHIAAGAGKVRMLRELLGRGAEASAVDEEAHTPLHWATGNNHVTCVEALLSAGCDVNAANSAGNTALHFAANEGLLSCVSALLQQPKVAVDTRNASGATACHWAAATGRGRICEILAKTGANLDARDNSGRTPLQEAALNAHYTTCKTLLRMKADVDAQDPDGRTVIHYVAAKNTDDDSGSQLLKLFLSSGAHVDYQDGTGGTALHCAAFANNIKAIALLLRCRADRHIPDAAGRMPIHWAAYAVSLPAVKLLMTSSRRTPNPRINVLDAKNKSPYDYCKSAASKNPAAKPMLKVLRAEYAALPGKAIRNDAALVIQRNWRRPPSDAATGAQPSEATRAADAEATRAADTEATRAADAEATRAADAEATRAADAVDAADPADVSVTEPAAAAAAAFPSGGESAAAAAAAFPSGGESAAAAAAAFPSGGEPAGKEREGETERFGSEAVAMADAHSPEELAEMYYLNEARGAAQPQTLVRAIAVAAARAQAPEAAVEAILSPKPVAWTVAIDEELRRQRRGQRQRASQGAPPPTPTRLGEAWTCAMARHRTASDTTDVDTAIARVVSDLVDAFPDADADLLTALTGYTKGVHDVAPLDGLVRELLYGPRGGDDGEDGEDGEDGGERGVRDDHRVGVAWDVVLAGLVAEPVLTPASLHALQTFAQQHADSLPGAGDALDDAFHDYLHRGGRIAPDTRRRLDGAIRDALRPASAESGSAHDAESLARALRQQGRLDEAGRITETLACIASADPGSRDRRRHLDTLEDAVRDGRISLAGGALSVEAIAVRLAETGIDADADAYADDQADAYADDQADAYAAEAEAEAEALPEVASPELTHLADSLHEHARKSGDPSLLRDADRLVSLVSADVERGSNQPGGQGFSEVSRETASAFVALQRALVAPPSFDEAMALVRGESGGARAWRVDEAVQVLASAVDDAAAAADYPAPVAYFLEMVSDDLRGGTRERRAPAAAVAASIGAPQPAPPAMEGAGRYAAARDRGEAETAGLGALLEASLGVAQRVPERAQAIMDAFGAVYGAADGEAREAAAGRLVEVLLDADAGQLALAEIGAALEGPGTDALSDTQLAAAAAALAGHLDVLHQEQQHTTVAAVPAQPDPVALSSVLREATAAMALEAAGSDGRVSARAAVARVLRDAMDALEHPPSMPLTMARTSWSALQSAVGTGAVSASSLAVRHEARRVVTSVAPFVDAETQALLESSTPALDPLGSDGDPWRNPDDAQTHMDTIGGVLSQTTHSVDETSVEHLDNAWSTGAAGTPEERRRHARILAQVAAERGAAEEAAALRAALEDGAPPSQLHDAFDKAVDVLLPADRQVVRPTAVWEAVGLAAQLPAPGTAASTAHTETALQASRQLRRLMRQTLREAEREAHAARRKGVAWDVEMSRAPAVARVEAALGRLSRATQDALEAPSEAAAVALAEAVAEAAGAVQAQTEARTRRHVHGAGLHAQVLARTAAFGAEDAGDAGAAASRLVGLARSQLVVLEDPRARAEVARAADVLEDAVRRGDSAQVAREAEALGEALGEADIEAHGVREVAQRQQQLGTLCERLMASVRYADAQVDAHARASVSHDVLAKVEADAEALLSAVQQAMQSYVDADAAEVDEYAAAGKAIAGAHRALAEAVVQYNARPGLERRAAIHLAAAELVEATHQIDSMQAWASGSTGRLRSVRLLRAARALVGARADTRAEDTRAHVAAVLAALPEDHPDREELAIHVELADASEDAAADAVGAAVRAVDTHLVNAQLANVRHAVEAAKTRLRREAWEDTEGKLSVVASPLSRALSTGDLVHEALSQLEAVVATDAQLQEREIGEGMAWDTPPVPLMEPAVLERLRRDLAQATSDVHVTIAATTGRASPGARSQQHQVHTRLRKVEGRVLRALEAAVSEAHRDMSFDRMEENTGRAIEAAIRGHPKAQDDIASASEGAEAETGTGRQLHPRVVRLVGSIIRRLQRMQVALEKALATRGAEARTQCEAKATDITQTLHRLRSAIRGNTRTPLTPVLVHARALVRESMRLLRLQQSERAQQRARARRKRNAAIAAYKAQRNAYFASLGTGNTTGLKPSPPKRPRGAHAPIGRSPRRRHRPPVAPPKRGSPVDASPRKQRLRDLADADAIRAEENKMRTAWLAKQQEELERKKGTANQIRASLEEQRKRVKQEELEKRKRTHQSMRQARLEAEAKRKAQRDQELEEKRRRIWERRQAAAKAKRRPDNVF